MLNIYRDIIIFGMINFYIEMMCGSLVFMRKMKRRKMFVLRLIGCFVLSGLLYFIPYINVSYFSLNYIIVFFAVSLQLLFCFKISYFNALFYAVSGFIMQHMGWSLMLALLVDIIGLANVNQAQGLVCYVLSYIICYALAWILFPAPTGEETEGKERVLLFVLSTAIIVLIYAVSAIVSAKMLWNIYARVYDIVCCVFALCVQFGIFRTGRLKSENSRLEQDKVMLEELLRQSAKQQALSKDTIDIINRKCHDLKHQISALRTMSEDERENKISEIEKAIMIYGGIAKTSNEVLNVVLTEKGLICEKYKIKFTYIVDGDSLTFMDPVDLSSLFGNAIDNAIESVSKEDIEAHRVIKLNVSGKDSFLGIHIENYCGTEVSFKNGYPVTGKDDKENHGIGLKSIKYVAEKYGGCVNIEYADNIFMLDILFPTENTI